MDRYRYELNGQGVYLEVPPGFEPPHTLQVPVSPMGTGSEEFYLAGKHTDTIEPEPPKTWPRIWPKRKFVVITSNYGEHKVAADKVLFQDGWVIFADGHQNEPRRNIKAYPAQSVRWIEEQNMENE